jgi:hypothetical protein
MPRVRFFFDAGSGGVLWPESDQDQQRYGCPVDLVRLPIGQPLRDQLASLVEQYDGSLNWDYPPDPGPWREHECEYFNRAARDALRQLGQELGPGWEIVDEFHDLHEDPGLDRYVADPHRFQR